MEFSGANKNAILSSNIFADKINFGSSNIIVPESIGGIAQNASLNGDTTINNNIRLNNSTLTFNDGDITFGPNTTITTALKVGGGFGKIVTKTKITVDSAMRAKVIKVEEEKDVSDGKYLFLSIQGGDVEFNDGSDALPKISSNQAYTSWKLEKNDVDGNIYAIRENVGKQKAGADAKDAGGDEVSQQNAEQLASNKKAISSIGRINPQNEIDKVRGDAIERVTTTVEAQVTEEQYNIGKAIDGIVLNRVSDVFTKTNNLIAINDESTESAVAAGDEDQEKMIGAWAIPFYSQANQKSKGRVAGYNAKTSGGILGFDVMPNDDVVLGAAVGVTKTDMKFKDIKSGDKSTINGLNFSLYGLQQLPDNFFIQGVASFNSSSVSNKEKQIRGNIDHSVVTEIAQGKYRSKSFDGEILLGYNAQFEDVLLIPTAALRYTKVNGISYKEKGTKFQNRTVSRKAFNKLEGIIGTKIVGSPIAIDNNTNVRLSGHIFVTQKLSGKTPQVKAKLDGQTTPFIARKDNSAKTLCNIGVNLTVKQNTMFEYGIGYDAYLASKYNAHQGSLKVRVNF